MIEFWNLFQRRTIFRKIKGNNNKIFERNICRTSSFLKKTCRRMHPPAEIHAIRVKKFMIKHPDIFLVSILAFVFNLVHFCREINQSACFILYKKASGLLYSYNSNSGLPGQNLPRKEIEVFDRQNAGL